LTLLNTQFAVDFVDFIVVFLAVCSLIAHITEFGELTNSGMQTHCIFVSGTARVLHAAVSFQFGDFVINKFSDLLVFSDRFCHLLLESIQIVDFVEQILFGVYFFQETLEAFLLSFVKESFVGDLLNVVYVLLNEVSAFQLVFLSGLVLDVVDKLIGVVRVVFIVVVLNLLYVSVLLDHFVVILVVVFVIRV